MAVPAVSTQLDVYTIPICGASVADGSRFHWLPPPNELESAGDPVPGTWQIMRLVVELEVEGLAQHEDGKRVESLGFGFSSDQSAEELNPQQWSVDWRSSIKREYFEPESVQLYRVTASFKLRAAVERSYKDRRKKREHDCEKGGNEDPW